MEVRINTLEGMIFLKKSQRPKTHVHFAIILLKYHGMHDLLCVYNTNRVSSSHGYRDIAVFREMYTEMYTDGQTDRQTDRVRYRAAEASKNSIGNFYL